MPVNSEVRVASLDYAVTNRVCVHDIFLASYFANKWVSQTHSFSSILNQNVDLRIKMPNLIVDTWSFILAS